MKLTQQQVDRMIMDHKLKKLVQDEQALHKCEHVFQEDSWQMYCKKCGLTKPKKK